MGRKREFYYLAPNIQVSKEVLLALRRAERREKEKIEAKTRVQLSRVLAKIDEWKYFNKKERRAIMARLQQLGVWDPELLKEILTNLLQEKIYFGRFWLP